MEYIVIDIFFPTILQLTGNDNYGAVGTSIQLKLTEPVSTLSVSMCLKLDCDWQQSAFVVSFSAVQ